MTRANRRVLALFVAFFAGVLVDSWLRVYGPPQPAEQRVAANPMLEPGESAAPAAPPAPRAVATTGRHRLRLPIDGADVESMKGDFSERRVGHPHEAVDLLAPRNTPIHAVADGTVAKLFVSKAGGLTIYQFDSQQQLCYYYAHLERYATGLAEGQSIAQGQVIGYVGTSGNAPANTPHLHFAVFQLGPERQWWKGTAIDPYPLFKDRS